MRLLAMITQPASAGRFLAAIGEATEVPRRSPSHWSTLLEEPHPQAPDPG